MHKCQLRPETCGEVDAYTGCVCRQGILIDCDQNLPKAHYLPRLPRDHCGTPAASLSVTTLSPFFTSRATMTGCPSIVSFEPVTVMLSPLENATCWLFTNPAGPSMTSITPASARSIRCIP